MVAVGVGDVGGGLFVRGGGVVVVGCGGGGVVLVGGSLNLCCGRW